MTRRLRRAAVVLLLGAATWHGGRAGYILAKAHLAQHLVRRAWQQTLAGTGDARPWPWADTEPVARLVVPGQGVDVVVLAGASGRTMAFGPGHVSGTPRPGERGNSVLSGHRDTHFAFLRRLKEGDAILVERPDRRRLLYAVTDTRVVDRRETWVTRDAGDTRLTLVTCYPFDAIRPGGPLRFVVVARLEAEDPDGLDAPALAADDATMKRRASRPPAVHQQFLRRFPRLGKAWDLVNEEGGTGPLDARTQRMLKLAIAVGAMREGAVHSGVRKARDEGVSLAEMEQVVALAASTIGFPASVAVWTWVREEAGGRARARPRG